MPLVVKQHRDQLGLASYHFSKALPSSFSPAFDQTSVADVTTWAPMPLALFDDPEQDFFSLHRF